MTALRCSAIALGLVLGVACSGCGSRREQSLARARENRESAYRANNRGVVFLEQHAPDKAVDAFREALAFDSSSRLATLNLPIALFYANRHQDADVAAAAARDAYSDAPQAPYVLGLVARAGNRLDVAADAFLRVLQIDPNDVGAKVTLAMVYVQQQKYGEAATLCESALAIEPYNATAAYNLGLALTRAGDVAQGQRALQRFEALRASAYANTYSQTYLEQGRYAEALASTGIEPDLVSAEPPQGVFADVTTSLMDSSANDVPRGTGAAGQGVPMPPAGAIAMADIDRDGDLDVISAGPTLRVLRNDRPRLFDITDQAGLAAIGIGVSGVVAADFNNDTRVDLLLLTIDGPQLFAQGTAGRFLEVDARAFPAGRAGGAGGPRGPGRPGGIARAAAFVDVDHDGDLDILLGGLVDPTSVASGSRPTAPTMTRLLQNASGTFTDITAAAGLDGVSAVVAVAPTDFDNRRDIDLLTVSNGSRPKLFKNLRDGSFRDEAPAAGLPDAGTYTSLTMGDVNKDGFTDFFFGQESAPGTWALSDGRGRFRLEAGPPGSQGAVAAQLFDYDSDGLLDLVSVSPLGPRVYRNLGRTWREETDRALSADVRSGGEVASIAAGDLDRDGDTDIVARMQSGDVRVWRNDINAMPGGGNRHRSLRVELTGRVSNRAGMGASVEMRAGSLYQKLETAATTPASVPSDLVFGLGRRVAADVVRVLWPSGILQAETPARDDVAATTADMPIVELNRKPSSCPYLFTWNGHRFEFVTDFLGGGEMGYWEGPGKRNTPDPIEYTRIRGDQLQPKDGRFEIRVTNELEEALFADRLQLVAITHPREVDVFPNEGMTEPPKPFRLYAVAGQRVPRATDDHGHDVTDRVSRIDRRYPDDFPLSTLRGYAAQHTLTLDLGPIDAVSGGRSGGPPMLLLTAWTDYAFSSDNVAAHQAGMALTVPSLQVKDARGAWRTAIADIGIPVGRPQTMVVDLAGRLRPGEREVRIVTSMRIYWDQILVANSASRAGLRTVHIDPAVAMLQVRGFSAEVRPDGQEPPIPDYASVTSISPWKVMPGRYTREGDVASLLMRADDMFVIAKPGDEIVLGFDAAAAGPLPDGWTRTFLLMGDGFSKEMDINSASPDTVEPLPFHRMTRYPYTAPERYPDTPEHRRYRDTYNTRSVAKPVQTLAQ